MKFIDDTEPFVFEWQNRRVGKFVNTATAQGADGEAVDVSWAAEHGITDRYTPPQELDTIHATAGWAYEFVDIVPPWLAEVYLSAGGSVSALQEVQVTFAELVT